MKKKVKILFFCMIFVVGNVFCQKIMVGTVEGTKPLVFNNQFVKADFYKQLLIKSDKKYFIKFPQTATHLPLNTAVNSPIAIISNNFYTQNFGFFCKTELQLEKAIRVPFKFRLGSVQQCDWMEGKANAGIR
jgi:hypothetical protein